MNFEFYTASRIIFGENALEKIGETVRSLGDRALVVLGGGSLHKSGSVEKLCKRLDGAGVEYVFYEGIEDEPEVETVDRGVKFAGKCGVNLVVGMGGGSVIDTAKAISGLYTNGGSVLEYLEGVGEGKIITKPSLPYIAVPTTSGTGAEVTKNAVIRSGKMKFKKSIRSFYLIPDVALVDPVLTLSVPPNITAWCGMDALTQLIEPYVSRKSQPMTDALAIYGIPLAARSLTAAVKNGSDLQARSDMALASLLSGCALANSGLGAAHGISAALGAHFGVPHGLACGMLLPYVMEINMHSNIQKFARIGEALTGRKIENPQAAAMAGVEFVKKLAGDINLPRNLKEYGIGKQDLPALAEASRGSSMNGNPVDLSNDDIMELIKRVVGT